jgi:hypothetical protein
MFTLTIAVKVMRRIIRPVPPQGKATDPIPRLNGTSAVVSG